MNEVNIKAYPKIKPMRVLQEIGGVYLFYLKGKVIYIGQTSSFNQREESHLSTTGAATLKGKLKKSEKYQEKDLEQVKVRFIPLKNKEKRLKIESFLIEEIDPPLNGLKGEAGGNTLIHLTVSESMLEQLDDILEDSSFLSRAELLRAMIRFILHHKDLLLDEIEEQGERV